MQRLQEPVGPVPLVKRTDVGTRSQPILFEAPEVVQNLRMAAGVNSQPGELTRTVGPAGRSGAGHGED